MSSRKNAISALYMIGQPLLLNVISIPVTAYIIHGLGALQYGQWALANALVGIAALTTNLGLRTLFVREVAKRPEHAAEAMAHQLGLRTALVLASTLLVIAGCWILGRSNIILICVIITSFSLVLTVIASTLGDVLQGLERFKMYSGVGLVSGLALTFASAIAVWSKLGPIGLSASYVVGPLITTAMFAKAVRRHCPIRMSWNMQQFKQIMTQSKLVTGQKIAAQIQERIEQLMIPWFVGVANYGIFTAGNLPASRLTVVPDGLMTAFYPVVSRTHRESESSAAKHLSDMALITMIICIPVAMLVTFAAGPIAHILLPKNTEACKAVMQVTIWSIPLMGIWYIMGCGLTAADKHEETSRIGICAHGLGLLISFALISQFGLRGACWAWMTQYLIPPILLAPLFLRTFPTVLPRLPFARLLASYFAMFAVLWVAWTYFDARGLLSACLGAIVSILAYAVVLLLLRLENGQRFAGLFAGSSRG